MKAHEILEAGLGHMKDRSATYDKPAGERSMGASVDAFRAITGHDLTEEQGWLFMGLLKMVRSQQGGFRADNYEDLAAYAGLQGEAAWAERANPDFGQINTIDYRTDAEKGFTDPRTVAGVDVSFPTEKHMSFAPEKCEHLFTDSGSHRMGSLGQPLIIWECEKCGEKKIEAEHE
jgi:hypothetical protein